MKSREDRALGAGPPDLRLRDSRPAATPESPRRFRSPSRSDLGPSPTSSGCGPRPCFLTLCQILAGDVAEDRVGSENASDAGQRRRPPAPRLAAPHGPSGDGPPSPRPGRPRRGPRPPPSTPPGPARSGRRPRPTRRRGPPPPPAPGRPTPPARRRPPRPRKRPRSPPRPRRASDLPTPGGRPGRRLGPAGRDPEGTGRGHHRGRTSSAFITS
jgi:hypothetical protein